MSMFHQRFTEHRFLESTLELLQQFYIQVESIAHDYKVFPGAWLGIPIFCSNFWDPHWKQNSGFVSDSKDSGRKIFNQIPLLKNQEIRIPIPNFGILRKKRKNLKFLISEIMKIVISQLVGNNMFNLMDVHNTWVG